MAVDKVIRRNFEQYIAGLGGHFLLLLRPSWFSMVWSCVRHVEPCRATGNILEP